MPQSARDEILKFLANCGTKTNKIVTLLIVSLGLDIMQICFLIAMLVMRLLK